MLNRKELRIFLFHFHFCVFFSFCFFYIVSFLRREPFAGHCKCNFYFWCVVWPLQWDFCLPALFCNCHLLFASDNGPFFYSFVFSSVTLKVIGRNWKTWMNFMFTMNDKSSTWIGCCFFFSQQKDVRAKQYFQNKIKISIWLFHFEHATPSNVKVFCMRTSRPAVCNK